MKDLYEQESSKNYLESMTLKIKMPEILKIYEIDKYDSTKGSTLEFLNIIYLLIIILQYKFDLFYDNKILYALILIAVSNTILIDLNDRNITSVNLVKISGFLSILLGKVVFNNITLGFISNYILGNFEAANYLYLLFFVEFMLNILLIVFDNNDFTLNLSINTLLTLLNITYFYSSQTYLKFHSMFYKSNLKFCTLNSDSEDIKNKDYNLIIEIFLIKIAFYLIFLNLISYSLCFKERFNFCLLFKFWDKTIKYNNLLETSGFTIASFKESNLTSLNKFGVERILFYYNIEYKELENYIYGGSYVNYNIKDDLNIESIPNKIKLLCFRNVIPYSFKLPEELQKIIKEINGNDRNNELKAIYSLFDYVKENKYNFKDFICIASKKEKLIGDKEENDLVFVRFNFYTEEVDICIINLNIFKKCDDEKEESYLSLAKITHEFKNPLITIGALIKSVAERIQIVSTAIMSQTKFQPSERKVSKFNKYNQSIDDTIIKNDPLVIINNIKNEMNWLIDTFKTIEDLGEYLMILIKDLDYYSSKNTKTNESKENINYSNVNIKDIIHFALSIFETRLKLNNKKHLEIETFIEDNLQPVIYSDEIRLKQIIINLLSNSLKFTKYGKITLKAENEDQEYIKFTVKDTGIGIQPQHLATLTQPYNKIINENNIYGSGLGLTIVKDFVSRLGKDLVIDTEFKKGTSISFLVKKNNELINSESHENLLNFNNQNNSNVEIYNINKIKRIKNDELSEKSGNTTIFKDFIPNRFQFNKFLNAIINAGNLKSGTINKSDIKDIINYFNKNGYFKISYSEPSVNKHYFKEDEGNKIFDVNNYKEFKAKKEVKRIASDSILCNQLDKIKDVEILLIEKEEDVQMDNSLNKFDKSNVTIENNNMICENELFTSPVRKDKSRESTIRQAYNNYETITIIVVDDELVLRKSQANLLKASFKNATKINIIECNDGISCLNEVYNSFLNGMIINAIITDQNMDFVNGDLLAEIIKKLIKERKIYPIKLYLITSMDGNNNNLVNSDEYFDGVYDKPLTSNSVKKIFKSITSEKGKYYG